MSVIVKICGNRRAEDLIAAAHAGADIVGIVFADAWRRISVEHAAQIVKELRAAVKDPPQVAGLFVDQPADEVNRTAGEVGLDMVQLHGRERPDYWRRIERPLIIARRLPATLSFDDAAKRVAPVVEFTEAHGFICLVEPHVEGAPGGAGVSLETAMAVEMARRFPIMLAGGLKPETVGETVRAVRPWGVDVSSGVDTNRVKDFTKVGRFVHEARRAALIAAP